MASDQKTGSRSEKRTTGSGAAGRKNTGEGKAARADQGAKSQARVTSIEAGGTKTGRGGSGRKATAPRDRDTAARPSNTSKASGRTNPRGRSAA